MRRTINYFTPKQKSSYFDTLVIKYFIYQALGALILLTFLISLNLTSQNKNYIVSSISEAALAVFIIISLFILKKKGIKIAGNIFYVVMVGIILISINILNENTAAMFKYMHGFYTILAFFVAGVLFASRPFIVLNTFLIFFSTTRIYFFSIEQSPENIEFFTSGYIYHSVTLLLITIIILFTKKFTELATERLNNEAQIIEQQNKQLAESEEQYRSIIESTSEGFWQLDANNITIEVNTSLCKMLEYTRDEILGKSPMQFLDKENQEIFKSKSNKTFEIGHKNYELTLKSKLEKNIPVLVNSTVIKNDNNEIIKAFALITDISKQKKSEQDLKNSKERLSIALSGANSGIWDWNISTGKMFFDANFYIICGYEPNEFPQDYNEWKKRVHPDDIESTEDKIALYLNGSIKNYIAEFRFKTRKNKWMWIHSQGKIAEYDNEGNPIRFTGINTNIDDRKCVEQALKENENKLRELNATKDKFFSIIAHDLKSPIGSMLGFSELLVQNFNRYDIPKQKKFLGMLNRNIGNTYKLLENLLLWSQSQKGIISFEPENENLFLLIKETTNLLSQLAKNKLIEIRINVDENIYVKADKNMLLGILRNLISNAIKFTPKEGEISVNTNKFIGENKQKFIKISIEDNGVGISIEKQKKLFEISENISTKGTEKEIGTGLGLILCKEFVEKHGGNIWVESEMDKGSKFTFTLPLVEVVKIL